MSRPSPPTNFLSWLDYAVAAMDARGAYLDRMFSTHEEAPSQEEIRATTQQELNQLKQKALIPQADILENWSDALSKKTRAT